jgi:membrane fusion protein, multidrug efflux system
MSAQAEIRRIGLDPREREQHPLLVGLSTTVKVDVHDQSGVALSKRPAWQASVNADVYAAQEAGADEDNQYIIAVNLARGPATASTTAFTTHSPRKTQ